MARPLLSRLRMFDRTVLFTSLLCAALISSRLINTLIGSILAPPISFDRDEPPELERIADRAPLSALLERNLFQARRVTQVEPIACEQASLRARLVATIIGAEDAIAWFKDGVHLVPIQAGDRLEGIEVIAVGRASVRLAAEGSCAEVPFAESIATKTPALPDVREAIVRRSEVESILSDPMRYGQDARIVPKPSQHGFALHAIKRGGIADRFGFANGDVIQRINGLRLDEPGNLFRLQDLLRGPELSVDYVRHGERRTLTLRIEDL